MGTEGNFRPDRGAMILVGPLGYSYGLEKSLRSASARRVLSVILVYLGEIVEFP